MADDRRYLRSSQCEGGGCVEISGGTEVNIRDSDTPESPLAVPLESYRAWIEAVKRGEFDSAS